MGEQGIVSLCCGAKISWSWDDGLYSGTCKKCGQYAARVNPITGEEEMLGKDFFKNNEDLEEESK